MVAYLLPIFGVSLGALVLSEPVDARVILGTALVLGGAALVNSRYGSRRLVLLSNGEIKRMELDDIIKALPGEGP